ncbi:MAG TPA: hypothetical protein VK601_25605 [Kofleriaceae bacterium]|nr:hypothetical protein [Kofleriaceae bacterium]
MAERPYEGSLGLAVGGHASSGVWTEYDLPGGGCLALLRPAAAWCRADSGSRSSSSTSSRHEARPGASMRTATSMHRVVAAITDILVSRIAQSRIAQSRNRAIARWGTAPTDRTAAS